LLSLIHVLQWRGPGTPAAVARSDQLGAELAYCRLDAAD
jgi:hypothetical protein